MQGPVVFNHVVLAELFARRDATKEIAGALESIGMKLLDLDSQSAWLAGQAHAVYRQRGGRREVILADFLIGAHAHVLGAAILTRDTNRFASYFPDLTLITPETHP